MTAKLIHLIGTSASGKSYVHNMINDWLVDREYTVEKMVEPGPLRDMAKSYRMRPDKNPEVEAVIFSVDRQMNYSENVLPRMDDDNLVFVFDRGLPDTVIYQGIMGGVNIDKIMKMNVSIPLSDIYLCLIVDGEVGHKRALERSMKTGEPVSPNETAERIDMFADAYRKVSAYFPNTKIIDTTHLDQGEVFKKCASYIAKIL